MNTVLRSVSMLALASAALAASAQNLVQDGDFESADTSNTYAKTGIGQSFDGGDWYVDFAPGSNSAIGILSVMSNSTSVISGTKDVNFVARSVRQTLATTAGQSYVLAFDAYANPSQPLVVAFGSFSTTVTVQPPASYGPPTGVGHFSLAVTATGPSTVLSLGDTIVAGSGLSLDNVSVTPLNPTPEPAPLAALGLGAVALVRRRRRA